MLPPLLPDGLFEVVGAGLEVAGADCVTTGVGEDATVDDDGEAAVLVADAVCFLEAFAGAGRSDGEPTVAGSAGTVDCAAATVARVSETVVLPVAGLLELPTKRAATNTAARTARPPT